MYRYEDHKHLIFTEEGQVRFLQVRDNVMKLLKLAGAVTMEKATVGLFGSNWEQMAHVDRLLELGEIREITGSETPGQCRTFTNGRNI